MLDISGRPLLGRVIDRAKCIPEANKIIVATSSRSIDDPIATFANAEGVDLFRGSIDDVALRALCACDEFNITKFARICGDRPFFDPDVVSHLFAIHEDGVDLATTSFPRTYPPGLTGEVIRTEALRRALSQTDDPEDKEHITRYFYQHPNEFVIRNIEAPKDIDLNGLRLVVDDESDLARARWIASGVVKNGKDNCRNLRQVVDLAREWDRINLV
jgi:spore coat polysaccharide biosynthesis protein SpsF